MTTDSPPNLGKDNTTAEMSFEFSNGEMADLANRAALKGKTIQEFVHDLVVDGLETPDKEDAA